MLPSSFSQGDVEFFMSQQDKRSKSAQTKDHLLKLEPLDPNDPFSYRHFTAFHPTANKLLSKKWDERTRELYSF